MYMQGGRSTGHAASEVEAVITEIIMIHLQYNFGISQSIAHVMIAEQVITDSQ